MQQTLVISSASAESAAVLLENSRAEGTAEAVQTDLVTLVLTVPASDLSAALAGHQHPLTVAGAPAATADPLSIIDPATAAAAPSNPASANQSVGTISTSSFLSSSRPSRAVSNDKAVESPIIPSTRTVTATIDTSSSTSAAAARSTSLPTLQTTSSTFPSSEIRHTDSPASTRAVTTIKVAAIPSIAIKPVIPGQTDASETDTMVVYIPAPTSSSEGDKNDSGFLNSLGTSPVNIALTALVCTGIAVLVIAAVAFFLRRYRRRAHRRRVAHVGGVQVDQSYSRYSDDSSAYDEDAHPIMQQVSAASIRSQARSYNEQATSVYTQPQQHHPHSFGGHYQFGAPSTQNFLDTENEKLREEDWNNEMLQVRRRSEMDLSLVRHLHASQPVTTPSIIQSSASHVFNYAPTVASSLYLEPAIGLPLRSTYLGSFSASVPTGAPIAPSSNMQVSTSAQNRLLRVPARPNRPASLTSSFTHAVERDLAVNPISPPTYVGSPASAAVSSAWGVRTISQVFNATTGAMTTLLSSTPTSPTYDEERADRFTALPDPASTRRPSVRWGSVTSLGSNAPDRRVYQQMPSRFSVTTLGTGMTNSPTQSYETSSAYDYQIQSATVAPRRAAPVLIAQREHTPSASEGEQDDIDTSDSSTLTDQPEASLASASEPWACTEPLATPSRRPTLTRLESVKSVDTVQSSIYDSADAEADGYEMTAAEQGEMKALIQKRRAAAMAAR